MIGLKIDFCSSVISDLGRTLVFLGLNLGLAWGEILKVLVVAKGYVFFLERRAGRERGISCFLE